MKFKSASCISLQIYEFLSSLYATKKLSISTKWTIKKYFFLIYMSFAIFSLAEPLSTQLLDSRNLKKINRELAITPEWYLSRTDTDEDIVEYLIRQKNVSVLRLVLDKGISVNESDVEFAFESFFNTSFQSTNNLSRRIFKMPNCWKLFPDSIQEKLILAIKHGNDGDNLEEIAPILTLFSNKEDLASTIADLYLASHLDARSMRLLGYYLPLIFLGDGKPRVSEILTIVDTLLSCDILIPFLLDFIICAYESITAPLPIVQDIVADDFRKKPNPETFSYILTELARRRLIEISIMDFISIETVSRSKKISSWKRYNQGLTAIVEKSIISPVFKRDRNKIYLFWSTLISNLVSNGNFNDTLEIASTLNLSSIKNSVSKHKFRPIKFSDNENNYSFYNEQEKHCRGKFLIPSVRLLSSKFMLLSEEQLLLTNSNDNKINLSLINDFNKIHRFIKGITSNAQAKKFITQEDLVVDTELRIESFTQRPNRKTLDWIKQWVD